MSDGCLGCQRCEEGPVVTLHDGRVVCDTCPDWRAECEARYVLNMPGKKKRREYLERIGKKRGATARAELERVIKLVWEKGHG